MRHVERARDVVDRAAQEPAPPAADLRFALGSEAARGERAAAFAHALLERELLRRLAHAEETRALAKNALARGALGVVVAEGGSVRVDDLADRAGIGERQLERAFKELVGVASLAKAGASMARYGHGMGLTGKKLEDYVIDRLERANGFRWLKSSDPTKSDVSDIGSGFVGQAPLSERLYQRTEKAA